jgi:hypothetical protein
VRLSALRLSRSPEDHVSLYMTPHSRWSRYTTKQSVSSSHLKRHLPHSQKLRAPELHSQINKCLKRFISCIYYVILMLTL